jgi:hypothetical protein
MNTHPEDDNTDSGAQGYHVVDGDVVVFSLYDASSDQVTPM